MRLNPLYALAAAAALSVPLGLAAQPATPALPSLTAEQSAQVQQQMSGERRTMEARVGRGEVAPDEAERFLAWREWQIAQQVTGHAPAPAAAPARVEPAPRYVYAYPAPYYYGPPPYYWGPRYFGPVVCAGGFGHHIGGRICF